ncbi:shikimate dehydrogenase [Buchnera aphidicola]|nr:shikimate dehydrogenase [Buchnera aphidicola]
MIINKNVLYSVFGNPINHSLSPLIHNFFSEYSGIHYDYNAKLIEIDSFEKCISIFFQNKYAKGANITAPFKNKAYFLSDHLTDRAFIAGSVNTFKKNKNNIIIGDNTDGVGILYDLKRLNYLEKKKISKILILGAGGAAKGIIPVLLQDGHNVFVYNRTIKKTKEIYKNLNMLGNLCILNNFDDKKLLFDCIINTTSCIFDPIFEYFPYNLFSINTVFYDICYNLNCDTSFLVWCKKRGALNCSDGLGMLISQAAYSFLLWFNCLIHIDDLINYVFKKILQKNYNF